MKQRIITAIGLAIVIVLFYFFGENYYIFQLGLVSVGVVGLIELFSIVATNERFKEVKGLKFSSYVIIIMAPFAPMEWTARLIILFAFIELFLRFIFSKENSVELLTYIYLMLSIFGASLAAMSYFYMDNKYYAAFFMFVAFGTDIFAYFGGYFFGKHKLIPWVSPKKTIEGAITGLLGSLACVYVLQVAYMQIISNTIPAEISLFYHTPIAIIIILVLSMFSQCGDLFFSKIKRFFATKDYGNILPGHGGVIDRSDGLIFVTLIFALFYFLIN